MLWACSDNTSGEGGSPVVEEMKYATTFHFEQLGESNFVVVDEPWPGASNGIRYDLSKKYQKIVCTSTSHLPFLELLGETDILVGFPSTNLISSEAFMQRVEEGLITDLGPGGSINMELLLSLNPDAVIAFDMGGESNSLNKIQQSGIPVIYNADFLESSPLGKAEWIKFFGALLNKQKKADSIFSFIESEYIRLRTIGSSMTETPTVLSGVVYGDTWFLPGGQNWSSIFLDDAGGEYIWATDSSSGWIEHSFESVYDRANNADFWIGTSTINTRDELLSQDERYASFDAFSNNQVYSYNKKRGKHGGYDFFESGYARPDLVLADLIKILHQDQLPDYETIYFQRLE